MDNIVIPTYIMMEFHKNSFLARLGWQNDYQSTLV
jgi:hypothetical protein